MTRLNFPIMAPPGNERIQRMRDAGAAVIILNIPLAMIEPHEKQALRNHQQTIERLAQRGGLDATEAIAVLTDTSFYDIVHMTDKDAHEKLTRMALEWATTGKFER